MKESDQSSSVRERMALDFRRRFQTNLDRGDRLKTRDLFFLVFCLLILKDGAGANKCHDMDLKEKVEKANVVVSGTIEHKYGSRQSNGLYQCDLKVMLLFKGQGLVTSNKLKLSNNLLHVEGFGDDHICNSDVHVSDTKLFFLTCDGKTTQLNSGILPVTLEILQTTEAIAKNRSYVPPALQTRKLPPCENKFCPFGAQCYVNTTSGDPYCKCITKCDSLFSPVCGSNMVSYSNECHMLRASCHQKKRITVMYNQPCEKHSKDNIGMVSD